MRAVLELENVTKNRGNATDASAAVLFSGITADVAPGESIALIGTSGQGKTTLLRVLSLLEALDAGRLALKQTPSTELDVREWRKQVCYVAQQAVMLPGSIEDNLRTVSRLHGQSYDDKLAWQLMDSLGLGEMEPTKRAADLSGGEKQRVALIRSLLLNPLVLLLDESTASLDQNSARQVEQTLLKWQQTQGTTLIWVTHDLEQAQRISTRTWFMAQGTLLEDAQSELFFGQPATEAARSFLRLPESAVRS